MPWLSDAAFWVLKHIVLMNREINSCSVVFRQLKSRFVWHFGIPTLNLWKTLQTQCPRDPENDLWVRMVRAWSGSRELLLRPSQCFCAGDRTQCCQSSTVSRDARNLDIYRNFSRILSFGNWFHFEESLCVLNQTFLRAQYGLSAASWEPLFDRAGMNGRSTCPGVSMGFCSIPCGGQVLHSMTPSRNTL